MMQQNAPSFFLLVVVSLSYFAILSSGQTFQYSRGWTNGKRSFLEHARNLAPPSVTNQGSYPQINDGESLIVKKSKANEKYFDLPVPGPYFHSKRNINANEIPEEKLFKMFLNFQNLVNKKNSLVNGQVPLLDEENDY